MAILNLNQHREALERYFIAQPDVVLAYLYGSQARGQAHFHSDVDIAVLLARRLDGQARFDARLRLIGDLMNLLHTHDVDVAILNEVPAALGYRVLRDGILLFCRDHDARIAYHLRTFNDYMDFKPILERHERAILEKARKGELMSGYNPHHGAIERHRQLQQGLKSIPKPDL
jgi:hypothetical protein